MIVGGHTRFIGKASSCATARNDQEVDLQLLPREHVDEFAELDTATCATLQAQHALFHNKRARTLVGRLKAQNSANSAVYERALSRQSPSSLVKVARG